MGIHLFVRQRSIRVSTPSTAQIKDIIYAANPVTTRNLQTDGIILAIAHVRKSNFAYHRCKESTRCTKSVDSESIVTSVLLAPLTVVNNTRRQRIQFKITYSV